MGVFAAGTLNKVGFSKATERLKSLGFTDEELHLIRKNGCSPPIVLEKVEQLLDSGLTNERYARETFADTYPELFEENDGNKLTLNYDRGEKPKNEIANYVAIMNNDDRYAGVRYNELSGRAEVHKVKDGEVKIVPWSDADEAQSMMYIESQYGLYSKDKHSAALRILFDSRSYNPIIDIVDNIEWDGQSRCEHFLHEWAKVEDSPYSREVSRLIFAGGIHRLYNPGCKFDDVPILIGTKQGEGKSSLIRFLAINDAYYGEVNLMEGQQAIEQLRGRWICEISELLALTKNKEQEAAKAYITRQVDSYRKPWDKNVSDLPRRCIMIGTTNNDAPLSDRTGARRFFPVEVHSNGYDLFDHEQECRDYILQCWAEARELYKAGKMPNFANRSLLTEIREAQENATQDDWRVGAIKLFLDKKLPGELTCVREVCHRALSPNPDFPKEPTLVESKDIGAIITRLPEWERVGSRNVALYGKQRCWRKRDDAPMPTIDDPFMEG